MLQGVVASDELTEGVELVPWSYSAVRYVQGSQVVVQSNRLENSTHLVGLPLAVAEVKMLEACGFLVKNRHQLIHSEGL